MNMRGGTSATTEDMQDLWLHMQRGLRTFIARRVWNEAEIDDILQEIFLRMHTGLDRLKDPERLVSWVFQIARHAIADYYRAPKRRREVPAGLATDMDTANLLPTSDPRQTADPTYSGAELSACLEPLIQRLSTRYREAVTLVELEGLSQTEAARRSGLSLSGMKSRVQRGRQQLKEMLEECCIIHVDRRRAITDYDMRNPEGNPCGLADHQVLSQSC